MARRKQAWMGWGAPAMTRVAGWDFDHRLNGYVTTAANSRFSCDCGEEFDTPSGYRKCGSCGRAWNSYVIGTDGHGKEASLEKVIVREIPVRKDVIVASKRRQAKGKCECWDGYERVPGTKPCAKGSCRKCDGHREARRYVAWCKAVGRKPSVSGMRRFRTAEKIVRMAALPESNELADDFLSSAGQPGYADKAYQLEHNPQWKQDSWGSHDPAARAQHVTTDRWENMMEGKGHDYLPTSWSPYYDESSGYNPVMRTPQGIASDEKWMAQGNPEPMTGITLPSDVLEGNDFGMFPKGADPSKFETWKERYPHLTQEQWDNRFIGTPPEVREERSKGTYPIEHSEKWQQWANDPAAPWRKNPNYTSGDSSGAESGLTIARRRHRYLAWCQYTNRAPSIKGYRKFAAAERTADRHQLRRRDLEELERPEEDEDISIQHFSNRRRAELFDITDEGETRKGKGKSNTPTMRKNPQKWTEHKQNGQFTKRWN